MVQAYVVYLLLMLSLVVAWRLAGAAEGTQPGGGSAGTGRAAVVAMSVSVLIYGLTLGLRYRVGGDYDGYVGYYLGATDRVGPGDVPYEAGFFWLIRALRTFSLPPAALFLATCSLQMLFMSAWLRRHTEVAAWYVYFFFTSLLVFESMNTIRQALAYSLVLSAMPALHQRRPWTYLCLVVLASLAHSSVLLFLPLYFVLDRDWLVRPRVQVALLVVAYVAADAIKDALFDLLPILSVALNYSNYSEVQEELFFEGEVNGFSAGMLFLLLTDAFIMLSSGMLRRRFASQGFRIYYNVYLIGALVTPVVLYANYIAFARMAFYFTAFKPVVLAYLVRGWMSEEGRRRPGWRLVALLLVAAYFAWFALAIGKGAAWCAPFQFVLQ